MLRVIHCKVEDLWKMVMEYQQIQKLLWALSTPGNRLAEQKATIEALKSRLRALTMDFGDREEIERLNGRIQTELKKLESLNDLENLESAEEEALTEYHKKWKAWQAKWTRFGAVEDYLD